MVRGLGKLLAVVVVAGGVGAALGIGISELTSGEEPSAARTEAATSSIARSTTTVTGPAPGAATTPQSSQDPAAQVTVTVLSAVLHPAATPSGERRRRGRLGVRVRVKNTGAERIVAPRPSLLAARQRIPTNARARGPGSRLGPLAPGATADVTLRFETAGAVTEQLTTQKTARILIAGRSWPITVTVGSPVSSSRQPAPTAP